MARIPRPTVAQTRLSDSLNDVYETIGILARAIGKPTADQASLASGPTILAYAQAIQTLATTADQLITQANALDARADT